MCEVGACWQLVPSTTAAGLSEAAELVVAVNSLCLVPWWIVNLKNTLRVVGRSKIQERDQNERREKHAMVERGTKYKYQQQEQAMKHCNLYSH